MLGVVPGFRLLGVLGVGLKTCDLFGRSPAVRAAGGLGVARMFDDINLQQKQMNTWSVRTLTQRSAGELKPGAPGIPFVETWTSAHPTHTHTHIHLPKQDPEP